MLLFELNYVTIGTNLRWRNELLKTSCKRSETFLPTSFQNPILSFAPLLSYNYFNLNTRRDSSERGKKCQQITSLNILIFQVAAINFLSNNTRQSQAKVEDECAHRCRKRRRERQEGERESVRMKKDRGKLIFMISR